VNHRLRFRYEPAIGLVLDRDGVWCPADHGGECTSPTVDEGHEPLCRSVRVSDDEDCDCSGYVVVDGAPCWVKEHLAEFVENGDGWAEVLQGAIRLPWVAVTVDTCGPDGNDPIAVHVVAEVPTGADG
jgi:hypothetical protein